MAAHPSGPAVMCLRPVYQRAAKDFDLRQTLGRHLPGRCYLTCDKLVRT